MHPAIAILVAFIAEMKDDGDCFKKDAQDIKAIASNLRINGAQTFSTKYDKGLEQLEKVNLINWVDDEDGKDNYILNLEIFGNDAKDENEFMDLVQTRIFRPVQ